MARLKIDYGIDLGTTNSAICRMEKGEPVVIKTDVLKDTMPSCVSFTKRQSVKAGDSAFNDLKSDKRRASKAGKKEASSVLWVLIQSIPVHIWAVTILQKNCLQRY